MFLADENEFPSLFPSCMDANPLEFLRGGRFLLDKGALFRYGKVGRILQLANLSFSWQHSKFIEKGGDLCRSSRERMFHWEKMKAPRKLSQSMQENREVFRLITVD